MNFEFISNLEGLGRIFKHCANAEELAISKPDLSMTASRKSAEALAKYVYFIAHSQEAGRLSFNDVLSDYVVKQYLNNRTVMDAFHSIRLSGNPAVHTLDDQPPEKAVAALKNLHYVSGEIAKRLGLISHYPQFDDNIDLNPNAVYIEIDEKKLSQEMFVDYISSQHYVDRQMAEFEELCLPFRVVPGETDVAERLVFKHKPVIPNTVKHIQEYFISLGNVLKKQSNDPYNPYSVKLTLYGENGYTTTDLVRFVRGIYWDLPNADGFEIIADYHGISFDPMFVNDIRKADEIDVKAKLFDGFKKSVHPPCKGGFAKYIDNRVNKQEDFVYTIYEYLYNRGGGGCAKHENGNWVDLKARYTSKIVDQDFGVNWRGDSQSLIVKFDYEKYPNTLAALHNAVRKHIPDDELENCEGCWKDNDEDSCILVNGICWEPRKLRIVQDFLDEINLILEPIKSECVCSCDGDWFITQSPFAVATWIWTTRGFVIKGTEC